MEKPQLISQFHFHHSFALAILTFILCMDPFHISKLYAQKQTMEFHGAQAQAIFPGAEYVKQSTASDYPEYVRFATGQEKAESSFFQWLHTTVKSADKPEFLLIEQKTDDMGMIHSRYVQTYKGIPLDQSHFTLHTRSGYVIAFNGHIKKIKPLDTSPVISENEALNKALQFVDADKYMWQEPAMEANLKSRKMDLAATHFPEGKLVISMPKTSEPELAYVFDISAFSPMMSVRVCVSAIDGSILYDVPMESNCSAASVNTIFNGNRSINTDLYTADDYRLRDDCTAAVIHVRDWNSADLTPAPAEIENETNTWTTMNEIFGGTTLWCVRQSYEYFLNTFSRDAYDDADGDLDVYINALFNCAPPAGCVTANNASMNFSTQTMKVGLSSAGVLTNSYATIDIIAHEYAHAVTASSAGLVYEEEWGALNESFSDIFGEAAEFFTFGSNDWLLGSERDNGAIRSLSNPNNGGQPDTYLGTNWFTISPPCDGSNDQCGVHTNSGVQNFWFYLLSVGGSGTNDNGDDYQVDAIGLAAAEAIAYRNLTVYLGANSNHADARAGSILAAIDLYGICSDETEAVMDAWYAVGVGDPFLNVSATVTSDYNGADVSCFGADDGEATAVAANGLPPYSYSWSSGQNTAVAMGLTAGVYTVTVTDVIGCNATATVTLTNPPMLSATAGINSDYNGWPISCFGACDGIAEALPVGGVPPYNYLWSISAQSQTTKIADELCAGEHSVIVTDNNGCTTEADVTLLQPPPLEIEAGPNQTIFYWDIAMACTSLEATGATGGVPPYTYSWSSGGTDAGEDICLEVREDTITIVTYYVTLTDANGCEAIDSLDVCYVDINCSNNNSTKVTICHIPPDNPLNPLTLCVSLASLVEHLSHGDHVAECGFVSPCGLEFDPLIDIADQTELMEVALNGEPFLDLFPHPVHDEATVRFVLHEDVRAELYLYDIHGKLVRVLHEGQTTAGSINDISLAKENLPAGIYMLHLNSPGLEKPVTRVVIMK